MPSRIPRHIRAALAALPVLTAAGLFAVNQFSTASSHGPHVPRAAEGLPMGIARVRGGPPVVALTFDDGSDPETTTKALAMLRRAQAGATFFVLGKEGREHPELLRRLQAAGMEIGCHGWDHTLKLGLPTATVVQEFNDCAAAVADFTGTRPVLIRPPYGVVSPEASGALEQAGYSIVFWSRRGSPKRSTDARLVAREVARGTEAGDIILLHDGHRERGWSIEVLPHLLRELEAEGFRVVTVSELLAGGEPVPESWREVAARYCHGTFLHPPASDCAG